MPRVLQYTRPYAVRRRDSLVSAPLVPAYIQQNDDMPTATSTVDSQPKTQIELPCHLPVSIGGISFGCDRP